ncbi:MAG: ATP-binding cassette domain-containing protein [Ruminococcus sp.]|nr:ATP-binding cassette domain-containing protein [Ruminococcus sp.]
MAVVEIKDLSFSYPECTEKALDNVSLTVEQGEFFVLCGTSGSGKSTLLRQLKTDLAPNGIRSGEIMFEGLPLDTVQRRTQSEKIGFVGQSPENQIATDKVWHELAFGLESLGYGTAEIRGRTAEMAAFFGIEKWFHKSVTELSGGQKQLLNLASVMTLHPDILILDEPTSQLDPIAASEFLNVLKKINAELGITVILTEHRLEEAFPMANRTAVMEKGKIICTGTPKEVGGMLKSAENKMFLAMPAPMRIWAAVKSDAECPVTAAEGKKWFNEFAEKNHVSELPTRRITRCSDETAVDVSEAWFRYTKNGTDVIRGLDLKVRKGEFLAVLGGNGAGKTTTLKLISGLKKPYRGEVAVNGKTASLPQNPQTLFVKKTVREDLLEMTKGLSKEIGQNRFAYVTALCRLEKLLDRHPYDLSGGEQQRAALAKILMTDADILLLDEPTKGFDAEFKQLFGDILETLLERGKTIIMVSHDIEFCAEYSQRCAMFFYGSIVTEGTPEKFFSGNSFYTTSANRIARDVIPNAITVHDVISACGGEPIENKPLKCDLPELIMQETVSPKSTDKLPVWRKITAALSGTSALLIFLYATKITDLTKSVNAFGITDSGREQLKIYAALIFALFICALSVYRKSDQSAAVQTPKEKRRLSKRTVAAGSLILMLIPLTLYIGVYYVGVKQYYAISLAILTECMLPFFMIFEGRKPQARTLVTIASLCALGIAGRAAFFMLPQFKPVAALTIISGVALGGETGFLVGAVTMLASNILFSQGPWTPFQMFAMGMIGFLAGILFRKGLMRRTRLSMCIFGALAVILIYGGIMNPASALIWGSETLNLKIIMTYYVTGFPMDLIHAAATVIFLWYGAEPMLQKLDRLKVKYRLLD